MGAGNHWGSVRDAGTGICGLASHMVAVLQDGGVSLEVPRLWRSAMAGQQAGGRSWLGIHADSGGEGLAGTNWSGATPVRRIFAGRGGASTGVERDGRAIGVEWRRAAAGEVGPARIPQLQARESPRFRQLSPRCSVKEMWSALKPGACAVAGVHGSAAGCFGREKLGGGETGGRRGEKLAAGLDLQARPHHDGVGVQGKGHRAPCRGRQR